MELVLTATLVIGAIGLVWAASQLGFAWVVVALVLSLGSLIYVILRQRAGKVVEHLYERAPGVATIRQALTPMEYSYRSNLDIPFFSFESQNYGTKTPRKRVRGIPIDRFLDFESRMETLLDEMKRLQSQLESLHERSNAATRETADASSVTAAAATNSIETPRSDTAGAVDVPREAQPRFDTSAATSKPTRVKEQLRRIQTELRMPFTGLTRVESRPTQSPTRHSVFDEVGNLCGSCGGTLKNYQCVNRCDPMSQ